MKRLLIILFSIGITLGATAQPKIGNASSRVGNIRGGGNYNGGIKGGGVTYVRPRIAVIAPYARMYPYYGYGYGFRFSPFYDPFYYSNREERPTQLDLQIEDIKNEYEFKIDNVKDDKSLTKAERKQKVRELKHQREDEIIEAKKNYYKDESEKDSE